MLSLSSSQSENPPFLPRVEYKEEEKKITRYMTTLILYTILGRMCIKGLYACMVVVVVGVE